VDAQKAIRDPIEMEREKLDKAAIYKIFGLTRGCLHFLQEWGSQAWNDSVGSQTHLSAVKDASDVFLGGLMRVFSSSF
jgi:hypothetical protein